jgi:hypothetical protein
MITPDVAELTAPVLAPIPLATLPIEETNTERGYPVFWLPTNVWLPYTIVPFTLLSAASPGPLALENRP